MKSTRAPRTSSATETSPTTVARALWDQRQAVCDFEPRLQALREAVDCPWNLGIAGWTHLYAIAQQFKPDKIIEFGRHGGNSTSLFTEYANSQERDVRVVSLDRTAIWDSKSVPRLRPLVGSEWFDKLEAVKADIMDLDLARYTQAGERTLLFWDAHGYELAHYLLRNMLPLLEHTPHLVVVHDMWDSRHCEDVERAYRPEQGTPTTYWADYLFSRQEELVALYDFLSRNRIAIHTVADDIARLRTNRADWDRLNELYAATYTEQSPLATSSFLYFSLAERADPKTPVQFPHSLDAAHLVSRLASPTQRRPAAPLFGIARGVRRLLPKR